MLLDDELFDETPQEDLTEEPEVTEEPEIDYKEKFQKSASGAQKLLNQKKQLEQANKLKDQVIDTIAQMGKDQSYLLEVARENPEVAETILSKYYDWMSIEDFEEKVTGKRPEQSPEKLRDQIRKEVEDSIKGQEVKKSVKRFIKEAWLTDEVLEKFEAELWDITEWKKLNPDNIHKYLKHAYNEIVGFEKKDNNATIAKIMSASWGTSTGSKGKTHKDEMLDDMLAVSKRIGAI